MNFETIKYISSLTGLFLFMAVFIGACLWTLRPGAKKQHDEYANIPFKEDDTHGN